MFYPATAEESGSGSHSNSGSNSPGSGSDESSSRQGGARWAGTGGKGTGAESSEDNLRQGMQIDMKGLVGDAVGNMSISPTSRDIVLAARRGLFIIDLESPLSVPRFLPQGGTWDVADVQWNPHVSRAEYIVSTSSEKLYNSTTASTASAPSSIAHVLHAHYRAITDINWHPAPAERDVVASTGIDSWIWAWDLRAAAGGRAVFGLSAFNAGGTQVKWNRQDPHVLASSHAGEVLIWDRRKGSLPITRLRAHRSKIYGIDWSPAVRDELVTCALDGEIKAGPPAATHMPAHTIRTAHPVWRARHLPFGRGVLSLPQRGGTGLGMYAFGKRTPVEVFEGHTDVVKEFVWRRGGDGTAFQLITWSKDRTLRIWPVHPDTLAVSFRKSTSPAPTFSFRNPPPPESLDASISSGSALGLASPHIPALSAPIGARAILAGVRAGAPVAGTKDATVKDGRRNTRPPPGLLFSGTGSIRMSRGTAGGRRMGMDALTWLSNVKEVAGGGGGGERSSSGGRGGGAGSSGAVSEVERSESLVRRRSDSRSRPMEEGQSLQDELTSVINKLVSAKIKLEKHDLTKRRTCTLGLHGPWGESSSVFIRITFTFPKDYPHGVHPRGTPTVELERNPLISLKNRAFMLRRLRALRERQRPCLEACLRFLSEGEKSGAPHPMDSESSDEGEQVSRKSRDFTVSLLRNHKNLAEPRTSQGTFGPNGELVCFFRAPPRIVRHVLRDLSVSASPAKTVSDMPTTTHDSVDLSAEQAAPHVFRSPALIADAVRRLSLAATDRVVKPLDPRRPQDGDHILRIMTNLLTFSHDTSQHHRDSESSRIRGEDGMRSNSFAYPAPRRSTVFITNTTHISGGDRKVATGYIFQAETLALVCQRNAEVAREHGRYDHERIFKILQALFPSESDSYPAAANLLVVKMVSRLHSGLCKMKDLQMLAMVSMIVLQGSRVDHAAPVITKSPEIRGALTPKYAAMDYFSIARPSSGGNTGRASPVSPTWPRLTASPPVTSGQAPLSTSNSSRGSWSSLFNAGSVRQFIQDSLKDGLTTPSEPPPSSTIPVPKNDRISRGPDSPLPRRRAYWRDSGLPSPSSVSKSWNETSSPAAKHAVSFSSAGHRRPLFSRMSTSKDAIHEARVVLFDAPGVDKPETFSAEQMTAFQNHVRIYADVLFSWQLFHKRLELLRSVNHADTIADSAQHGIGMIRSCVGCGEVVEPGKNACPNCSRPCSMPQCTVCRLPVKGLSRSCLRCLHVTHISCWKRLDVPICPSGCGCLCDNRGFAPAAPFATRSLPASSAPITPPRPPSKGLT
ncbi:hypothetical protein C8R47DRAFT_990390 [Mycena vitilis]|nr:hypothetical protein C8R47DRAFT_990390 [Mycena vitilis]